MMRFHVANENIAVRVARQRILIDKCVCATNECIGMDVAFSVNDDDFADDSNDGDDDDDDDYNDYDDDD